MNALDFLKIALKDHKVAALSESSQWVVERISDFLPDGARHIVEYGPGSGVITRRILNIMPREGKLIAVELNNDFYQMLSEIKDSRLTPVKGDVMDVTKDFSHFGDAGADAVISTIPFSFLNSRERSELIRRTARMLRPGGRFITGQYSFLIFPLIRRYFQKSKFTVELRNFPPFFVMWGEK